MRLRLSILLSFFVVTAFGQTQNLKFTQLGTSGGLSRSEVQCIYQDRQGFMWFGTRDGLNRYDGYKFKVFRKNPNNKSAIASNDIKALLEDNNANLLVATADGGLTVLDLRAEQFYAADNKLPGMTNISNYIHTLYADGSKVIWLGSSDKGLYRYDAGSKTLKSLLTGNASNQNITNIIKDSKGNIWAGTGANGIYIFSAGGKYLKHYGTNDGTARGLTHNNIKFIYQDHQQRIWVGTYGGGLHQYDAATDTFKQVQFENSFEANAHRFLLCMEEDTKGNLWIGTENGGLSIYNPVTKSSVTYHHVDNDAGSISSNTINCIKRDKKGNMWIGTANSGISMVRIDEGVFTHYKYQHDANGLSNNIVNGIFEDDQHRIWIGTDGGGLDLFNPLTGSFKYYKHQPGNAASIAGNYVLNMAQDGNHNIWVGTWGDGVTVFNPATNTYKHFRNIPGDPGSLSNNNAFYILHDSKNRMWVGTYGGGLDLYNEATGKFSHFVNGAPGSISSNYILTMHEDRNGIVWVGTDEGGLNKYNGDGTFSAYTTVKALPKGSEKFSNNTVTGIWDDADGNIWAGTSYGLNYFNPRTLINKTYFAEDGLANDAVGAVLGDTQGYVWISTNKGLSRFDPKHKTFRNFSTADGLQSDEFKYGNYLDKAGRMYFGGRNGFNVFTPDKIQTVNFDPPVVFTNFQLFNSDVTVGGEGSPLKVAVPMAKEIVLSYKQSSFSFEFASLNYTAGEKKQYRYKLVGYESDWHNLGTRNSLTYTNLDPGTYTLMVKGLDNNRQWSAKVSEIKIIVTPPFWKTWWFKLLLFLAIAGGVVVVFYLRLSGIRKRNRQLEREVSLRTQQLSDTNSQLVESYDEIRQQNESLEVVNKEISRKTDKILQQQEQIVNQNQQLENTVNELEASNKTKDMFFSILAHDLKNPIAALTGLSDLLKTRLSYLNPNEVVSFVHDISRSSNSINNLVINMLDWARTQSSNLLCQPVNINLRELALKNVYLVQIQLANKNIDCKVEIDTDKNVYADYQMLNTIVRNLLSNAIKFTPVSGKITISAACEGDEVMISITDSGIGMTAEQLQQLQEPQLQVSLGTAGETGTGLGLQICRDFVQVNNGRIQILSTPGKGTVITIIMPKALNNETVGAGFDKENTEEANDVQFDEQLHLLPDAKRQILKGKRILIVEDNQEMRNYLKALLAGVFEIFEADNGVNGLRTAKETQPELIITDLIMPVMNGLEFCNAIKSDVQTSHLPVLLLTSEDNAASQLSGYEAGADIYLTKPVNRQLLLSVIFNFIKGLDRVKGQFSETDKLIPDDLDYNKLDREFLEKMSQFIELNLSNADLDYKMLSDHAAMSRTVLYAKFKSLTGMGVHDFIKNIRLKKALELLQQGGLNVSQIAYEVGFATPSYFSKSFTKQYKMTPKEYVLTLKNRKEGAMNTSKL
ncbi:response regulator [Mucilaginibacter conchicola]|uniref:histidine kinase n=1 Tax=Mucilaginibacter conchicola TaxID=2303333 RepID=A0A372NV28_9SPHI|nr:two-component regulator propeller domain-containing protein [Mucilaginibacter conchicola]RFZ94018.1 response regulator [Mucilaginibacter conchicola]